MTLAAIRKVRETLQSSSQPASLSSSVPGGTPQAGASCLCLTLAAIHKVRETSQSSSQPASLSRSVLEEAHLKQVPLVHQLALALLQLGPQPPQLALILAQQGALVHILIHPGRVADVLGSVGELQGAQ